MNNTIKFCVDLKNSGKRIDIFLAENISHLTRSFLKKLIANKNVKLNDIVLNSPSTKIKFKDKVAINIINKRNRIKFTRGKTVRVKGYKKAIVTLKKGQSIDLTTGI